MYKSWKRVAALAVAASLAMVASGCRTHMPHAATWAAGENRATNAPFQVFDPDGRIFAHRDDVLAVLGEGDRFETGAGAEGAGGPQGTRMQLQGQARQPHGLVGAGRLADDRQARHIVEQSLQSSAHELLVIDK